jgi:hypothetical protein
LHLRHQFDGAWKAMLLVEVRRHRTVQRIAGVLLSTTAAMRLRLSITCSW